MLTHWLDFVPGRRMRPLAGEQTPILLGGEQPQRSNGSSHQPTSLGLGPLFLALVIYIIVAAVVGGAQKEQLNSDAVCYLRNALYWSEGRWSEAISGYWSPLLSWSIAPFIAFKMEGVYAGHLTLGLWGVVFILAAYYFMRKFTTLTRPWDTVAMAVVAVKTATWITRLVTPDLILSTCLLVYCAITLLPGLLQKRRYQIAAGLIGGLAYLAKSYGLPFFLVHLPGIIALRYWWARSETSPKQAVQAWLTALGAFCLIAGPWIGILSAQHGRLTFSTVAKVAHSVMGPHDKPRGHPTDVLRTPAPGRLTVWETPHVLPYNHWSPLENRAYFWHQVKLVGRNTVEMVNTFSDFDFLRLFPGLFLVLPLLFLPRRDKAFQLQTSWVLWSVALYAGGFLPIYYEARYVAPFLWPLCFLYLVDVLLRYGRVERASSRSLSLTTSSLVILCALSFLLPAVYELQLMMRKPATSAWRHLAQRLPQYSSNGAIAASPGMKSEAMLVSYLTAQPFLGPASGENVAAVEAGLEKFGASVLLVRENKWPLAERFLGETRWKLREVFDEQEVKVYIFTPPDSHKTN